MALGAVSAGTPRTSPDLLHDPFDDRVEPASTNVLKRPVHLGRHPRNLPHRLVLDHQLHVLGFHELDLLLDQVCHRLRQDLVHVVFRKALELDLDRQPALQLGEQVARLRVVERARAHEEDKVRVHVAVLGIYGGALDQRQQVALDALRACVRAAIGAAGADLVDLVDEDDAALLHGADGFLLDVDCLHEFFKLLLLDHRTRLTDPHLFHLARPLVRHLLELAEHFLHRDWTIDLDDPAFVSRGLLRHLHLDRAVIQRPIA
mmetsp:Transcript_108617/g.315912  ORF Transcript_108617/g.315912 Transcript_108617/m.315912 type:complete len:261 (-) Transcript_108617:704-1486(-)